MTFVPRFLRRLARDQRGAVAVTLALSMIPLSVAALGAVDLTRAVSARSQLQDALDAATLAAARTVTPSSSPPSTTDNANIQAAGDSSWGQNLSASPDFTVVSKTFRYQSDGKTVQGDASATVQTVMAQVFTGGNGLTVKAHSEVVAGGKNLEIALVLDRTGSMKGAPLTSLKAGATDFVNQLMPDTPSLYTTKISVVPYSVAVNLGPSLADDARGAILTSNTKCPEAYGCSPFRFQSVAGGWNKWDASTCVTERNDDPKNAYTDVAPSVDPLSFYYPDPDHVDAECPAETMLPLTRTKKTITDKIASLNDGGNTAGHIGLAWGWYTLAPNFSYLWPNSGVASYTDEKTVKILVLMTDGNFNIWYYHGVIANDSENGGTDQKLSGTYTSNGSSTEQAEKLCANIRASGVIIYSVGYGNIPASGKTLLKDCANNDGRVYFPKKPEDLRAAYNQIAQSISQLRLSQ